MIDTEKSPVETFVLKAKKPYQSPELVAYGTVAQLTENSANAGTVFDSGQGGKRSH
jgi:hypothetical protein